MEQRKLIKLGNSSFAIALPKKWVEKTGLKKGANVFIERNGRGELIVSPSFEKGEEKRIEISLNGEDDEFMKKNLHAAYTKGYNEIIFKGNLKNEKKIIKDLLNSYLSFEIIDANENQIVVKNFFDIKEAKFENFVRRIDNNLRDIFSILLEEVRKPGPSATSIKDVAEIDKAINRFYFLCSRIFLKGIDNPSVLNILKMDGNKLFSNWWISFNLEGLGDGLKYVLKWVTKLKPVKKEIIINILENLHKNYIKTMESFYEENSEKALEVIEDTKKIRQEIEKLEKQNPKALKITEALEVVEKKIYQIAKMIFYMKV